METLQNRRGNKNSRFGAFFYACFCKTKTRLYSGFASTFLFNQKNKISSKRLFVAFILRNIQNYFIPNPARQATTNNGAINLIRKNVHIPTNNNINVPQPLLFPPFQTFVPPPWGSLFNGIPQLWQGFIFFCSLVVGFVKYSK